MVMFCNMKNRIKMKLKCTNCGKEFPKEMLAIECPDCYILGGEKERTFERERILELMDKIDLNDKYFSKLKEATSLWLKIFK